MLITRIEYKKIMLNIWNKSSSPSGIPTAPRLQTSIVYNYCDPPFFQYLYVFGIYRADFFEDWVRIANFILHNMVNFEFLNNKIVLVTNFFVKTQTQLLQRFNLYCTIQNRDLFHTAAGR